MTFELVGQHFQQIGHQLGMVANPTVMPYRVSPEFIGPRDCVTDDAHYRESVGTEPVIVQVIAR